MKQTEALTRLRGLIERIRMDFPPDSQEHKQRVFYKQHMTEVADQLEADGASSAEIEAHSLGLEELFETNKGVQP